MSILVMGCICMLFIYGKWFDVLIKNHHRFSKFYSVCLQYNRAGASFLNCKHRCCSMLYSYNISIVIYYLLVSGTLKNKILLIIIILSMLMQDLSNLVLFRILEKLMKLLSNYLLWNKHTITIFEWSVTFSFIIHHNVYVDDTSYT